MNDLVCRKHHYNGTFILEMCPICKIEREKEVKQLKAQVKELKKKKFHTGKQVFKHYFPDFF